MKLCNQVNCFQKKLFFNGPILSCRANSRQISSCNFDFNLATGLVFLCSKRGLFKVRMCRNSTSSGIKMFYFVHFIQKSRNRWNIGLSSVDIKTKSNALARLGLTLETSILPPRTIHHPCTDKTDIKPMYFNTLQKHKAVCLLRYGKQTLKFPFNRVDKSEFS